MSKSPTDPPDSLLWAVVWLAILGVGIAEWGMSPPEVRPAPLPERDGDQNRTVRNLYGWTPVDVALLADALSGRAQQTRYVVAGYPGADRLNGPLLTRTALPDRTLDNGGPEGLERRRLGGGWRQLTLRGRDDPPREPQLSAADVYVDPDDGTRRPCPRVSLERFACAPAGWSHVRWKTVDVEGDSVSCIWSHPIEDRRIVIDYGVIERRPDAEPYRLRSALDDDVADERGEVEVDIRAGDRRIDHRHRAKRGWQTSASFGIDGAADLSVAISADRVGRRHFCFRIE